MAVLKDRNENQGVTCMFLSFMNILLILRCMKYVIDKYAEKKTLPKKFGLNKFENLLSMLKVVN